MVEAAAADLVAAVAAAAAAAVAADVASQLATAPSAAAGRAAAKAARLAAGDGGLPGGPGRGQAVTVAKEPAQALYKYTTTGIIKQLCTLLLSNFEILLTS